MKIHNVNGFLILCRFLSFTHKRKFGEVGSCVLERTTPGSSYSHTHTDTHTDNIHNCTYTHAKPHRHTDTYMITYTLTHSDTLRYTNGDTHALVHNS